MKKNTKLNEKQQIILQDMFRGLVEGETMENIAKRNGIARKTLSSWKNTDHGKQLHAEFQREMSEDSIPVFYQLVHEKMHNSFKDRELFAKLHGLMKPEKQEITNKVENHDPKTDGYTPEQLKELEELLEDDSDVKHDTEEIEKQSRQNVVNLYAKASE